MITALYDGRCVICISTREVIRKLDWRNQVEFLDLHATQAVENRYPSYDHEAMMGEIHVVADDTLYRGFDGTRRMLKEVPLGFPIWAVLQIPGMRWLGVRVYRFIARNRYAVNRLFGVDLSDDCADGACKIPQ